MIQEGPVRFPLRELVNGTGREGFPKSEAEAGERTCCRSFGTNLLDILTDTEASRTETCRERQVLEDVKLLDPAVPEGGIGLSVQ